MNYAGQCACGAVRATFSSDPLAVRQCWCRQCQQLGGGGPVVNVIFPVAAMELSGALATNNYVAASGNTMAQFFCSTCGTPVMGQSKARQHVAAVRMGFLDPGHNLIPQATIWTVDAPTWALIDHQIESWPKQAPPPAKLEG